MWIFRLTAVSLLAALLWTAPAGAAGTKPGAPTNVHAAAGAAQASVSFTPGPSNGSPINSYSAACVPTSGGTTRYATASSSPVTVTSMTPGAAYRCKVQAHNANGWGAYSAPSSTVTPTAAGKPAAPTNVQATAGVSQATVSFTPGSSNGSAINSYSAACVPTSGGTSRYAQAAASPITVPSMSPGVAYRCKVQAHNASGWGAYSALSSTVTPTASPVLFTETWPGETGSAWPGAWSTSTATYGSMYQWYGEGQMSSFIHANGYSSARLSAVAARANSDVVFSYRWPDNGTQPGSFEVALRGSDFDHQWPRNAYVVQFSPASTTVNLTRRIGGTAVNSVPVVYANQAPTAVHWVRFQVQGSQARFRVWMGGQTEPTGWNTYTDAAPLAAGQTAFSILTENDSFGGHENSVLIDNLTVRSLP